MFWGIWGIFDDDSFICQGAPLILIPNYCTDLYLNGLEGSRRSVLAHDSHSIPMYACCPVPMHTSFPVPICGFHLIPACLVIPFPIHPIPSMTVAGGMAKCRRMSIDSVSEPLAVQCPTHHTEGSFTASTGPMNASSSSHQSSIDFPFFSPYTFFHGNGNNAFRHHSSGSRVERSP